MMHDKKEIEIAIYWLDNLLVVIWAEEGVLSCILADDVL